jgi:hypothetical protein
MSATIVSLSEARAKRVLHRATPQAEGVVDPEKAETFRLLDQIRRNLGLPPDYSGNWVITRRPENGR